MNLRALVAAHFPDLVSSRDPHVQLAVKVVATAIVLLLTYGLSRTSRGRVRAGLERGGLQIDVSILLARLLWIGVWLIGLGICLYVLGVGLTPFAALIGVIGLAASLAFQQVLQNLVAGVYLLAERPFHIGDRIAVVGGTANHEGTVEDIQMRTTHLRNRYDELILVPNSTIFSGVVTNRTAVGGHATHVTLTFPRQTDPRDVRTRIAPMLRAIPGVLDTPLPQLQVDKVGKDEWTADLLFWVSTDEVGSAAVWAVADAFPDATVDRGDPAE